MSAGTRTRARGAAVPPASDGFAQLLRAEWTKFRTVRGWVIAVIVAAVLIDALGLFLVRSSIQCGGPGGPGGPTKTGAACLPRVPTGPGGEAVTDSFSFVRKPMAGRGSITVEVASLAGHYQLGTVKAGQGPQAGVRAGLQPWSKAGIIIKASTAQGSAYAAMMVTGRHGVRMQYDYTGDIAGLPGRVSAASPRWLRLTRSGDTITGYDSADGSHWTRVGAVTLAGLPATVQAGMFAASPPHQQITPFFGGSRGTSGPSFASAVFDHVSTRGTAPGSRWSGTVVGGGSRGSGPNVRPLTPRPGVREVGGRFTVTGTGDIAPLTAASASGVPTATVEDHLVGAFFGLIVLVVIGAMFMTAEFRRGLIRTTFAASPRRGRVLAAKAIVIGLVTFVLGLASASAAVTFGVRLARGQGNYVLPVSWLTDVRVVAGTAALLAVAAVLALAIGAVARRGAIAVASVIVVIVLPYLLGVAEVLPLEQRTGC